LFTRAEGCPASSTWLYPVFVTNLWKTFPLGFPLLSVPSGPDAFLRPSPPFFTLLFRGALSGKFFVPNPVGWTFFATCKSYTDLKGVEFFLSFEPLSLSPTLVLVGLTTFPSCEQTVPGSKTVTTRSHGLAVSILFFPFFLFPVEACDANSRTFPPSPPFGC